MSWSRGLGAVAALALAGGLSGCFQPLYSEAAHPGLVANVRAIEVAPIQDRIGHYLADNLDPTSTAPARRRRRNIA